jgi:hypothetical protein
MNRKCFNLITLFILITIITVFVAGCSSGDSEDDKARTAYYCSQTVVESNLKSPSTADFPLFDDATVTKLSNDRYKIESYVDAENSYGAKIRSDYSVTIVFTGSDEYTYEDLFIN